MTVRVAEPLRYLLRVADRHGEVTVPADGVSTLVHVVESLGVPRTEIGDLRVSGQPAPLDTRPEPGAVIEVQPVRRPQPIAAARFVLDVHFGTLARWMRLLGLDTAYRNDASDPELVEQANAEGRVLLTHDRGLLRRRALSVGGYVHSDQPEEQLDDVLDRFDPPLAPWTRCLACNGRLESVPKHEIEDRLPPGTRRGFDEFHRCADCANLYWPGAHSARLDAIVARAVARGAARQRLNSATISSSSAPGGGPSAGR